MRFIFIAIIGVSLISCVGAETSGVGSFRNGAWLFDSNQNWGWDGSSIDSTSTCGLTGDIPVTGDWNADAITDMGVFRPSTHMFYIDYNGNGIWDGVLTDKSINFGLTGDLPVSGNWNSDVKSEIGVFRPSTHTFYLDYNGDWAWSGAVNDRAWDFGVSGDLPVTGDWNNNGISEIGVFRDTPHTFYLDYNGNGAWSAATDRAYNFGASRDIPLSGDWNGIGGTEIGVYRSAINSFYLDYNGNGAWNGEVDDRAHGFTVDTPVTGKWKRPPVQTTFTVYADGVADYLGTLDDFPVISTITPDFYNNIAGLHGDAPYGSTNWVGIGNPMDGATGSRNWNFHQDANSKANNADFAFHAGHGDRAGIIFGTPNPDIQLGIANMRFGGNNGKAKWVVLDSCLVMNQDNKESLKSVFNGLHILMGFDTVGEIKSTQEPQFAQRMTGRGETFFKTNIMDSWRLTLQYTIDDPAVRGAYMYAKPCQDDYLPGFGPFTEPVKLSNGQYDTEWRSFDCKLPLP